MTRSSQLAIALFGTLRHGTLVILAAVIAVFAPADLVLGGNVRAFVDGAGNLRVNGDHDRNGNRIQISMSATRQLGPTYLVRGGLGTTINNLPEVHLPVAEVERDLKIHMGYGPDQVKLNGVTVREELTIDSGNGDDDISLKAFVYGNIRIHTRNGDDTVFIHNTISGDLNEPSSSGDFAHHQALMVDTGSGNYDVIWSIKTSAIGSVTLRSHSKRSVVFAQNLNAFGHLDVFGSAHNDYVYLYDSYVASNVDILLRMQADLFIMDGLSVDGNLHMHMGMGDDFSHGYDIFVREEARFDGGHGDNDFIQLKASRFGQLRPIDGFEHQLIAP